MPDMKKTDYLAVLTLAQNLKKEAEELSRISDDLNKNTKTFVAAGIRDDSKGKIESFSDALDKNIQDSVNELDFVYKKLLEYFDGLVRIKELQDKL